LRVKDERQRAVSRADKEGVLLHARLISIVEPRPSRLDADLEDAIPSQTGDLFQAMKELSEY
jgi:hypothetical protein